MKLKLIVFTISEIKKLEIIDTKFYLIEKVVNYMNASWRKKFWILLNSV